MKIQCGNGCHLRTTVKKININCMVTFLKIFTNNTIFSELREIPTDHRSTSQMKLKLKMAK